MQDGYICVLMSEPWRWLQSRMPARCTEGWQDGIRRMEGKRSRVSQERRSGASFFMKEDPEGEAQEQVVIDLMWRVSTAIFGITLQGHRA